MRKAGLIGGLSWVATAHYYRRLNELTQEALGGVASARIVLESVNRQQYVDAVIEREDENAACEQIAEAAHALEQAGADFLVITCNDVHRFVPAIASELSIPFLHIAEVTADAAKGGGVRRLAILGVRKTMEGNFYPDVLARHGIEAMIPNEGEKAFVHDTIYAELTRDVFRDETRSDYLRLIEALATRGADGVALACTEIPLLIDPADCPIPAFSTTELHCRATVERMIAA